MVLKREVYQMVQKLKGIKVKKDSQEKFKFTNDGSSNLGDSIGDSHEIKGVMEATGAMAVDGAVTLHERLAGFLFSPPHIDAAVETVMVQDFIDNAATMFENALVEATDCSGPE